MDVVRIHPKQQHEGNYVQKLLQSDTEMYPLISKYGRENSFKYVLHSANNIAIPEKNVSGKYRVHPSKNEILILDKTILISNRLPQCNDIDSDSSIDSINDS